MSLKRTHAEMTNTSSNATSSSNNGQAIGIKTTVHKPPKKNTVPVEATTKNLDTMLQPIKHVLEEPGKILNYNQFKNFLKKAQGPSNIQDTATEYVKDVSNLASFMHELSLHQR